MVLSLIGIVLSKPALFVIGAGLGFAAGRIKNAKKLAVVNAEIKAIEGKITFDAHAVLAKIRAKL